MNGNPSPHEILKGLLQGVPPPRPLIMPIVFALGARVENLSWNSYLSHATKITNALRQLRGPVGGDGVTCYFDPLLEVEALGGKLEWVGSDAQPRLNWPASSTRGSLPRNLRAPEEAAKSGRVPVAVDVIHRLKTLYRNEVLLIARLTGPFTLAAQLLQYGRDSKLCLENFPDEALEVASSTLTQVSSRFGEAGANVIFLHEEFWPQLSPQAGETWSSLIAPALNMIRFYEALPVVLVGETTNASKYYVEAALPGVGHCVFCVAPQTWKGLVSSNPSNVNPAALGIAIPLRALSRNEVSRQCATAFYNNGRPEFQPAIITTAGDVPVTTDTKAVVAMMEEASR
jgi:hypothetical protein